MILFEFFMAARHAIIWADPNSPFRKIYNLQSAIFNLFQLKLKCYTYHFHIHYNFTEESTHVAHTTQRTFPPVLVESAASNFFLDLPTYPLCHVFLRSKIKESWHCGWLGVQLDGFTSMLAPLAPQPWVWGLFRTGRQRMSIRRTAFQSSPPNAWVHGSHSHC